MEKVKRYEADIDQKIYELAKNISEILRKEKKNTVTVLIEYDSVKIADGASVPTYSSTQEVLQKARKAGLDV